VLDVMMPELDGYEVCRRLKANPRTQAVPVLFLTALTRPEDETRGFEVGGADFIHKPFNPATVQARVQTHLQLKALLDASRQRAQWLQGELEERLRDVDRLRDATVHVMVSFAEFRDEETGNHVRRTQEYVRTLARWLRASGHRPDLSDEQIDQLARSAPLHDIGKVAIPDRILLKPGPLNPEELDHHAQPRRARLGDAAPKRPNAWAPKAGCTCSTAWRSLATTTSAGTAAATPTAWPAATSRCRHG
jgi:putative two-component system response regulator